MLIYLEIIENYISRICCIHGTFRFYKEDPLQGGLQYIMLAGVKSASIVNEKVRCKVHLNLREDTSDVNIFWASDHYKPVSKDNTSTFTGRYLCEDTITPTPAIPTLHYPPTTTPFP